MTHSPSDRSPTINLPTEAANSRAVISQTTFIAILLFVMTCGATFWTGMYIENRLTETSLEVLVPDGLAYAVPLMLILLCHEMGHYLTARAHGVPATPPFFLPMPFLSPLGTLGALIIQARGYADRRAMFDIAIAGPIAGFVVAVPVAWYGVQHAVLAPFPADEHFRVFGDPLLLKAMVWLKFGEVPAGYDVQLNPLLLAGWAGLFLTGLNLAPIGQLDGGHIVYCLLRQRSYLVSYFVISLAIGCMIYFGDPSYSLMVVLLLLMGIKHPPTANDHARLGLFRIVSGWATLALFFVCFTPFPLTDHAPELDASPAKQLKAVDVTDDTLVPVAQGSRIEF